MITDCESVFNELFFSASWNRKNKYFLKLNTKLIAVFIDSCTTLK